MSDNSVFSCRICLEKCRIIVKPVLKEVKINPPTEAPWGGWVVNLHHFRIKCRWTVAVVTHEVCYMITHLIYENKLLDIRHKWQGVQFVTNSPCQPELF